MPSASRNTASWLHGHQGTAPCTVSTHFLGQRSTLNAAKPSSIPKAGLGSRSRPPAADTPGPGQYNTAYSSIRLSGATIKGGPKKGKTRETQLENGARLDRGAELPGHYEKLSTFGMQRKHGGSIAKARRTINWMDKREAVTSGAQLLPQKSTLVQKATPLIRTKSPRFQTNIESTPGPGRYNTQIVPQASQNRGVRFDQSKRSAPVGSNVSIHTWFQKSDIPGPADYAPKSVADHKKERGIRRAQSHNMSVMTSGSQYQTPRLQTPRIKGFNFAPKSRDSK